jgi:hypothetical protein
MRIKKHTNKNEYLLTGSGVWVRNFCKPHIKAIDINDFGNHEDHDLFVKNEFRNLEKRYAIVEEEKYNFSNVIIASDGYQFRERQELLGQFDGQTYIIATNGALAEWKLMESERTTRRNISFYLVNNPYANCLHYLPRSKYAPICIASSRTNPEFLESYQNNVYLYRPTHNQLYSGPRMGGSVYIDDYRNPICAAIHLAHKFQVKKILLFCCDDSFAEERPAAVKLENGLWTYPQQIMGQQIIDGMLYWMKQKGVKTGCCGSGINHNNATYIPDSKLHEFFKEE